MFTIGLKVWSSNTNYIPEILRIHNQGSFDYLELYSIPDTYDATIHKWQTIPVPFVVHGPHACHSMNLSKKESLENNKKLFQSAKNFADTLKSPYIILHPGIMGSIDETISQIKGLKDDRIVLENNPLIGINGEACVCSTPEEMSMAMKATECGFCLDIGHAICSANAHKSDPIKYLNGFLKLSPAIFHLSDGNIKGKKDEHLHFGEGSYPLAKIMELLPENARITIETPKTLSDNLGSFAEDVKLLRKSLPANCKK